MIPIRSTSQDKVFKCMLLIVAFFAAMQSPLASEESAKLIQPSAAKFRFTFENIELPANEKMGFLGSTVVVDATDWLRAGVGAYGALTGNRGGFITLGLASEIYHQFYHDTFELNAGVFGGAGGGRGGFQLSGGGLMVRYHAGVQALTDWGDFGVGYSYIDFPNGNIHSGQPFFSYDFPFYALIGTGWIESEEDYNETFSYGFLGAENEFALALRTYLVPSGVKQDNGVRKQHPTIRVIGIEWNRYLNDNWFAHFETAGAMGGRSQGYMQILFGGGYRYQMFDDTWLKWIASTGVAGGGAVATGGGFLVDGAFAVQQKLGNNLYAEVSAGYTLAPGADFKAVNYIAKLGYHYYTPDIDDPVSKSDLAGYEFNHMRLRAVHQTYQGDAPNWRSRDQNLNVDLLGAQIDYFLNQYLFLSGQGIAAYKGRAGAYMIGLVGAGVHAPLIGPLFAELELLGGAAGGGSLAVGTGLIWQANASLGCDLGDSFSVMASYGFIGAPQGTMKAKVISASLNYHFTLFSK